MKLCARLGAQRHPAEPSTGTSAPKAGKIAEGGKKRRRRNKNAKCRNKEMAISRRLEGLRSSRLDHSMQNFTPELLEALLRPDSLDLEGKITNKWGRDRRRREKSPKAEKLPKAGNGRKWGPKSSDVVSGGIFSRRTRISHREGLKIAEGGNLSKMESQELRFCLRGYLFN